MTPMRESWSHGVHTAIMTLVMAYSYDTSKQLTGEWLLPLIKLVVSLSGHHRYLSLNANVTLSSLSLTTAI